MKHHFLLAIIIAFLANFSTLAFAEVIFSENWNSGTINTSIWNTQNFDSTSNPAQEVQEYAPGEFALRCKAYAATPTSTSAQSAFCLWNSSGGTSLYSTAQYERGNDLRMTFRIWHAGSAVSEGVGGGPLGGFYFGDDSDAYNRIAGILGYGFGNYGGFRMNDGQAGLGTSYDWGSAPQLLIRA